MTVKTANEPNTQNPLLIDKTPSPHWMPARVCPRNDARKPSPGSRAFWAWFIEWCRSFHHLKPSQQATHTEQCRSCVCDWPSWNWQANECFWHRFWIGRNPEEPAISLEAFGLEELQDSSHLKVKWHLRMHFTYVYNYGTFKGLWYQTLIVVNPVSHLKIHPIPELDYCLVCSWMFCHGCYWVAEGRRL